MGDGTSEYRVLKGPSRRSSGRQVVWTHGLQTSGSSVYNNYDYDSNDDGEEEVYNKIYSVFAGVKSFPFKTIIFQFWRPVSDLVLAPSPKVYAAPPFIRLLRDKYRPRSLKYQYSIHEGRDNNHPAWIISGGPVLAAFRNRFPEAVLDLRELSGSPLVDVALECELTCCVMLPVFLADECLGVVECSMKHPSHLLPIFNEMERELEKVGLSIYHVQGKWPYKTIPGGLEPVKVEIEKALGMACESHGLSLGQVWISYESENNLMSLVKLSWYSVDSDEDPMSSIKDFYDKFDVISLNKGDGLVSKTLQNHKSHLCRNIYKLRDNRGVLALLSATTKCASFVICLRSSHTGELGYAFEFFWPHSWNHLFTLEVLLSTLKKYLPSFNFASGGQLDDEVFVVDVGNSYLGSESRLVKVPQGNEDEGDGDGDGDYDVDDDLAILATYRNEILLFDLPRSSTFEDLMVKLKEEFELDPAWTYKVEYEDFPNKWSSLVNLESCRRKEDMGLIKLRVLGEGIEVGWRWRSNS
ncbi:protein NLP7-like [Bidens hawaiensis]|uniref:protein NLP7-like n=1 Tax=Bidens hawaiensis TaxID=980011 RepID=UPI00404B89AD